MKNFGKEKKKEMVIVFYSFSFNVIAGPGHEPQLSRLSQTGHSAAKVQGPQTMMMASGQCVHFSVELFFPSSYKLDIFRLLVYLFVVM